jgi:Domain of unknown function (DUF397)
MTTSDLSRALWRKSIRSGGNGNCVEVAGLPPRIVAVRDSKQVQGPALMFTAEEWATFIVAARRGGYDIAEKT